MSRDYLGVFKASYDYVAQSDDEVAIKEDQTLLLIERTDDECVSVRLCGCKCSSDAVWRELQMVEGQGEARGS
jgi:hypothetical protein